MSINTLDAKPKPEVGEMSGAKNFLPQFSDAKIRQALKDAGGHVKKAADALNVGWSTFYRRLKAMREKGAPIKTAAALAKAPARKAVAADRKLAVKKRKTAIKKARAGKWAAVDKAPVRKKAASAKKAPAKKKTAPAKKAAVRKKAAKKRK